VCAGTARKLRSTVKVLMPVLRKLASSRQILASPVKPLGNSVTKPMMVMLGQLGADKTPGGKQIFKQHERRGTQHGAAQGR
jgi:uncharacterized spore protein YtfJ